jgi:hypothetical protein
MKRLSILLLPFALLLGLAAPAQAADIGVTIAVVQPGLQGQVRIGPRHNWAPVVYQPVISYEARPVPRYDPYWQPVPAPVYRHAQYRRHAWRHGHHHHHHHDHGRGAWHR